MKLKKNNSDNIYGNDLCSLEPMHKLLKFLTLPLLTLAIPMTASAEPSKDLVLKISKIGTVKEVQKTSTDGMFAWLLEKNGKTLVIYNTPDNKSFIKGEIYNLETRKILSKQYSLDSLKYASPEFKKLVLGVNPPKKTTNPDHGYMNIKWTGNTIPDALKMIDGLAGAKEGKGAPQDTLYIFYDPNCTWCHATFDHTRPYIKAGYTIKWLPTFARGKTNTSLALNAAALQNPNNLSAVFDRSKVALNAKPSEQQIKSIDNNLQFLFAYHNKVMPDVQPSVPFGIFLDKSSGKVTHIQGLSEKPILELLYGDLK